jgi:hypothetical protein
MNTTRGKSRKRKSNDERHRKNHEFGGRMHKTMRGKNTNMEKHGKGSRNEGHGRKIKRGTGKGLEIFMENKHPSIG